MTILQTRRASLALGCLLMGIPALSMAQGTYELPVGPGRHFLNGQSKWAARLAGGWQLTTTERYQSGAPLSLLGSNSLTSLGYTTTANYVCGDPSSFDRDNFNPITDRALNAAAFSNPSAYSFGNLAPTLSWLRAPTQKSEGISLNKTTRLTEKVRLETGLDALNTFNFVRWGIPNTSITSSSFGLITYVQGSASTSGAVSSARTLQINVVLKF